MKKNLIYLFALGAVMTACSSDDAGRQALEPQEIRLGAGMDLRVGTRGGVAVQGTAFEAGENIDVFITEVSGDGADSEYPLVMKYTTTTEADGQNAGFNKLTGAQKYNTSTSAYAAYTPMWPTTGRGVNIYAWYPVGALTSANVITGITEGSEPVFTVAADQSTAANAGYKASDLMFGVPASNPVSRTSNYIPLTFTHKLSKVIVRLSADKASFAPNVADDGGTAEVDEQQQAANDRLVGTVIELVNVHRSVKVSSGTTGALLAGSAHDKSGDAGTTVRVVTIAKAGDHVAATELEAAAIIPPQTVAEGTQLIKVTLPAGMGSGVLYYSVPTDGESDVSQTFSSAKVYNYGITVQLTGLQVSSKITDWAEDSWGTAAVPATGTITFE